jgi:nucleoid DNA-binding protein
MATTTKREIAERVAQQSGLAQVEVKQVIQMLFDEIVKEVCAGNRLEFRDFGVFEVVVRKPRTGRNPRTGHKVAVPPKTVVTFKMGKVMKEKVASAPGAAGAAPAVAPQPPPPTPPPAI